MEKRKIITAIWIIYLIAAVVFLINAMSGMTGYVVLEGTSVGISTLFIFVFIAATVLLVLYNRKSKKR